MPPRRPPIPSRRRGNGGAESMFDADANCAQCGQPVSRRSGRFCCLGCEIAAALGRPLRDTQIAPDDFVISMRAYAPEDVVQLLSELFTVVLDGRNSRVTPGVMRALGRPPRDFSDYVRRAVASGVWTV